MKIINLFSVISTFVGIALAKVKYTGVNEAGAEFGSGKYPGVYNTDYVYPNTKSIQASIDQGMNIFRVGFSWERIQRSLNSNFDSTELERLDEVIEYITSNGAVAILNPHNFARYNGGVIGSSQVPSSAFSDLWKRFAQHYKSNNNVWFGLVNEPHSMPTEQWFSAARDAVDAVRNQGASNMILVPGNQWTGGWAWSQTFYGNSNADVALQYFSSSDKNIAFEIHQYFDSDFSGTNEQCVKRPCQNNISGFVDWLKKNNLKGFLGEFAGAQNSECKACVKELLDYVDSNSDVVLGWTWWASGPWWGKYMFSLEPVSNKFPQQMAWIKPYLAGPSKYTEVPIYDMNEIAPQGAPYCKYCNVTGTGGDGSLWGWEDEASCVVDYAKCQQGSPTTTKKTTTTIKTTTTTNPQPTQDSCWSTTLGYQCCNGCNVVYTDNDGKWGVENNQWCGISNNCNSQPSCWASALGYQCCSWTNDVVYTDNDGKWGIENDQWCGIN